MKNQSAETSSLCVLLLNQRINGVRDVVTAIVEFSSLLNNLTGCLEVKVQKRQNLVTVEKKLGQDLLFSEAVKDTVALVESEIFSVVKDVFIFFHGSWVSNQTFGTKMLKLLKAFFLVFDRKRRKIFCLEAFCWIIII